MRSGSLPVERQLDDREREKKKKKKE